MFFPEKHSYDWIVLVNKKPVCFKLRSNMHMHYAFGKHIHSFSSMTTYTFPAWQIYFFFLIYANNYLNCKHVSFHNTNAHEMLSDSNNVFFLHLYVIFVLSHLWSFQYSLFGNHVCSFVNAYKVFTVIHKYFKSVCHVCSFASMTVYIFLI